MSEPLATLGEVKSRLDWELDDLESSIAEDAAMDLSEEARHYGLASWTTPEIAPTIICRTVAKAAARFMKNYSGYTLSRAGDESLGWDEQGERAGSPYFTSDELRLIRSFRGMDGTFGTLEGRAWHTAPARVSSYRVPTDIPGERGFPYPREDDRL